MEIPNYDCQNSKNENFKQIYPYMPKDTFRMLVCGGSGCGKTNMLYHMLMQPLLYYDQLHLYAKNLEQDKYKKMIEKLSSISEQVGYNVIDYSNDEIMPVKDLDSSPQKIIVFDDYVTERNQQPLIDYFIQGRHKNCSVIYLSQSYYSCPKDIRLNCSHFCIYDFPSTKEKNMICIELGVTKDQYLKATKKRYLFLYVDKPMKTVKRNFFGNI